jgi:sugar phosphate isomerase/epimerase
VNTGNWSAAPHLDLANLLADAAARRRFRDAFESRGLELTALNANGNQLHPTDGARQSSTLHATVRLAGLLGVETVCLMSGLPAGGPEDRTPNWIVSSWPPETGEILAWQWREQLIPYWRELASLATDNGVARLCVELHCNQLVYNIPSLSRLRL